MTPANAFRSAVVAALRADSALSALVGSRVYEEAPRDARGDPSDAKAPFVYIGALTWRDLQNNCGPLHEMSLRLYAVSTKFGREEARDIADAMRVALHRRTLALAGGHDMAQEIRCVAGGDVTATETPKECFLDLRAIVADANGYEQP